MASDAVRIEEGFMLTRRGFAALASMGALAAQTAGAQTPGDRRAEVEGLRQFAEATHPRGREAAADENWRSHWDAFAAEADRLSDGEYLMRIRRGLGWFKDGHTSIFPFAFTGGVPAPLANGPLGLELPLRVQAFHDGLFVTEAANAATPLLGAEITRVGALDAVALMRAWAQNWTGSDVWAHRWVGELFQYPAQLQAIGATTDPNAPITFEGTRNGRRVRASVRPTRGGGPERESVARPKTLPEQWREQAGFGNFTKTIPDRAALYISIDQMNDEEGKSFEAFSRECAEALETPGAERVLLDLRRNGGGNNFLLEPFRKRLLRSRFNRDSSIYVLAGPTTFSAAQNPCTRLDRDTQVLFVGEPTGGSPNHYGDAARHDCPATGLMAFVSTIPWFDSYPMDRREWIMPDLPAPAIFADWRAGRDAALEAALSHAMPAAPLDPWEGERAFYFARPSQREPWTPFWRAA
jgi:hypothetical protein